MKHYLGRTLALFVLFGLTVSTALAQVPASVSQNPLSQLALYIVAFINNILVPLVFSIAVITFLFGIFQYFIAGGADEEKRKTGRSFAVWSVIALAIMVSLWGLVNLLIATFGFGNATRPCLPTFNGDTPCTNSGYQAPTTPNQQNDQRDPFEGLY